MIRERHELGPTSMNVNISIYTSPNLKKTIEARNECVVRTFRVLPFGPDTTRHVTSREQARKQNPSTETKERGASKTFKSRPDQSRWFQERAR